MKDKSRNDLIDLVVQQNLLIWEIAKSFVDIDDQLKNLPDIFQKKK